MNSSLKTFLIFDDSLILLTKSKNIDQYITAYDRSYGIQKIFDLHMKKEYKQETLFIAAGILDRYIYLVGA